MWGGRLWPRHVLGDPPVRPPLRTLRDETPPPAAVAGDPAVGAVGRSRETADDGRERAGGGQQPEERAKALPAEWSSPAGSTRCRRSSTPAPAPSPADGRPHRCRGQRGALPDAESQARPCPGTSAESRSRGRREGSPSPWPWTSLRHRGDHNHVGRDRGCAHRRQPRAVSRPSRRPPKERFCKGTFTPTRRPQAVARPASARAIRLRPRSASQTRAEPHNPDAGPARGRGMAVKFTCRTVIHRHRLGALVVFLVRTPETSSTSRGPAFRTPRPGSRNPRARRLSRPASRDRDRRPEGMFSSAPTTSFATSEYRRPAHVLSGRREGRPARGAYSWEPEDGTEYLTDEPARGAPRDYLQEEIRERWARESLVHLEFTLARDDDPLDDPDHRVGGGAGSVGARRARGDEVLDDAETPEKPAGLPTR